MVDVEKERAKKKRAENGRIVGGDRDKVKVTEKEREKESQHTTTVEREDS